MLYAKQLAILGHRFAAFHPRCNVVGLHFLNLPVGLLPVLLHAVGTDAALALIHLPLYGIVKSAQVQELLVTGQDVLVDA